MRSARAPLNGRRPACLPPPPLPPGSGEQGPVAGRRCWSPALHPPAEVNGDEALPCAPNGRPLSFLPSFSLLLSLWVTELCGGGVSEGTGSHPDP